MMPDAVQGQWPDRVTDRAGIAMSGAITVTEHDGRTEHRLLVRGESPEHLVAQAMQSLLGVLGGARFAGEDEAGPVVPFQGSGGTLETLLQTLVDDILERVEASPVRLVDVEVSHVMKTDEGLRSWGYLRFGSGSPVDRRSRMVEHASVTTLTDGDFELRMLIAEEAVESPLDALAEGQ